MPAGNPGAGLIQHRRSWSTRVTPTAAVTVGSSDVNLARNTATVTFGFNEAPVGFTLANITAQSAGRSAI